MNEFINNITTEELNFMVQDINSYDGYFDEMNYQPFDEEFFNIFFDKDDPMEICRATVFGDVHWNDDFIYFDAYGNLKSISSYEIDQEV